MVQKEKSQVVFLVAAFICIALCVPGWWMSYKIHWALVASDVQGMAEYKEVWKVFAGAAVYQTIRLTTKSLVRPLWTYLCKEKHDPVKRENYIEKSCESTPKLMYFVFSTYWGYTVLKNADWLPGALGGSDDMQTALSKGYKGQPFATNPPGVIDYGLYTFGYHLSDLVDHVFFKQRRNDHEEMLLHHIAAVTLYAAYIQGNWIYTGTLIAFVQDIADIFVQTAKMFSSTSYKSITSTAFIMMITAWAYTRLYIVPYIMYGIVVYQIQTELVGREPRWLLETNCWLFLVVIFSIFALSCWWYYIFMVMLYNLVFKGEVEDKQQRVEGQKED